CKPRHRQQSTAALCQPGHKSPEGGQKVEPDGLRARAHLLPPIRPAKELVHAVDKHEGTSQPQPEQKQAEVTEAIERMPHHRLCSAAAGSVFQKESYGRVSAENDLLKTAAFYEDLWSAKTCGRWIWRTVVGSAIKMLPLP